jgi:ketosteroid isomerase-like protein
VTEGSVLSRLDRLESESEIRQLVARYALAMDARDIEGIVELYSDNIKVGAPVNGVGHDALREWLIINCSDAYRSAHMIAGHVLHFDDDDHAHGSVHCRCEQEVAEEWLITVVNYNDSYVRENGRWRFARRRPQTLYTADILERPLAGKGDQRPDMPPVRLPAEYSTFGQFWQQFDRAQVEALTKNAI